MAYLQVMAPSDDKPDVVSALRALKPAHALPPHERPPGVAAPQGRPRKIEPAKRPDDYAVQLDELRQQHLAADPIVRGDGDQVLATMLELAREAAALGHERRRLELLGRDAASVSSRRIDALVRIAAIEVARSRHGPGEVNVRADKFQRVAKYFFEVARQASEETLDAEAAEQFWARVEERLAGWEDRVDPLPGAGRSE